jgi:hypothetical protein
MSPEAIRDALMGVRYGLSSHISRVAASVYQALGVKHQLDAEAYLS